MKTRFQETQERFAKSFDGEFDIDKLEEFEKAVPVGTINAYGKQKQSDGTWKHVSKKGKKGVTRVKHVNETLEAHGAHDHNKTPSISIGVLTKTHKKINRRLDFLGMQSSSPENRQETKDQAHALKTVTGHIAHHEKKVASSKQKEKSEGGGLPGSQVDKEKSWIKIPGLPGSFGVKRSGDKVSIIKKTQDKSGHASVYDGILMLDHNKKSDTKILHDYFNVTEKGSYAKTSKLVDKQHRTAFTDPETGHTVIKFRDQYGKSRVTEGYGKDLKSFKWKGENMSSQKADELVEKLKKKSIKKGAEDYDEISKSEEALAILGIGPAADDFEKGHPIGYVNKYGKEKMSDGTWKYKKQTGPEKADEVYKKIATSTAGKGVAVKVKAEPKSVNVDNYSLKNEMNRLAEYKEAWKPYQKNEGLYSHMVGSKYNNSEQEAKARAADKVHDEIIGSITPRSYDGSSFEEQLGAQITMPRTDIGYESAQIKNIEDDFKEGLSFINQPVLKEFFNNYKASSSDPGVRKVSIDPQHARSMDGKSGSFKLKVWNKTDDKNNWARAEFELTIDRNGNIDAHTLKRDIRSTVSSIQNGNSDEKATLRLQEEMRDVLYGDKAIKTPSVDEEWASLKNKASNMFSHKDSIYSDVYKNDDGSLEFNIGHVGKKNYSHDTIKSAAAVHPPSTLGDYTLVGGGDQVVNHKGDLVSKKDIVLGALKEEGFYSEYENNFDFTYKYVKK